MYLRLSCTKPSICSLCTYTSTFYWQECHWYDYHSISGYRMDIDKLYRYKTTTKHSSARATCTLYYMPRFITLNIKSQIAKFMGPTWGPPGSCRPQAGPMLAHKPCYQGYIIERVPVVDSNYHGTSLGFHVFITFRISSLCSSTFKIVSLQRYIIWNIIL